MNLRGYASTDELLDAWMHAILQSPLMYYVQLPTKDMSWLRCVRKYAGIEIHFRLQGKDKIVQIERSDGSLKTPHMFSNKGFHRTNNTWQVREILRWFLMTEDIIQKRSKTIPCQHYDIKERERVIKDPNT